MLCSAYKGVLPSDLFDKYDCRGGWYKLEYDLSIAAEMTDRINEQMDENKVDGKRAVANRNKRRVEKAALIDSKEMGNILTDWADN